MSIAFSDPTTQGRGAWKVRTRIRVATVAESRGLEQLALLTTDVRLPGARDLDRFGLSGVAGTPRIARFRSPLI